MADDKTTIKVEITTDGKQKIDQYIQAFDTLRDSVNNLAKPFNALSNDLSKVTDAIDKINSKNQESVSLGDKVKAKITDVINSYKLWEGAVAALKIASISLQTALTGGLALFTAFIPEIINYAAALFKGKEASEQAKLSFLALSKGVSSTDYSTAIQNVTQLTIKMAQAKKGTLDKDTVVKEYNKTIGQTVGQVKTLEQVETSLQKNAGKYIEAMRHKATAMAAIKEAAENQIKAEKERNRPDEDFTSYLNSGLDKNSKLYKSIVDKKRDAAVKTYTDASDALKKIAATNMDKAIEDEKSFPINQLKSKIAALQKQTASGIIGTQAFKDLEKLKKVLREVDGSAATVTPATTKTTRVNVSHTQEEQLPKISANEVKETAAKKLLQTADAFNKQLEQQHNNYGVEQAALKNQLNSKLITQEEYFLEWQKLQEKYHTGIGETIKLFNERDLATAQQHQKDMVDAQQQEELINKDKNALKKAILPGDKLAAEKKLITDKYEFEIQKAAEAGRDTAALREQYQQEITEATKRHEQERQAFVLETSQKVSDTAFSILQNNIRSQSNDKLKELEAQKDAELSNTSLTASQKKAIEDKYKKKEAEEKVKAFKSEQRASILQAVINGALAVTKAMAQTGILSAFVIPGIIASTAIQVATIAAQKPPKYAQGGLHYQSDGKGAVLPGYSRTDNTNAYLRSGEAVVVSEAMRNPWARNLVSAINVAYGGRDFSVTNPNRGYAIGGIFTDGGNSNRYYNQPMNDQKDLANTIAYQMINNFPPVYVDVKDINTQQNIMAQTINRVNL